MSPHTPPQAEGTLLSAFLSVARNRLTIDDFVLECESDRWTYGELDIISSAIALELHERFGARITVASIHENHPYILALLLAIWKLGGVFAPLDAHAPPEMLAHMLTTISPTCAAIPAGPSATRSLTDGMKLPLLTISAKDCTLMELLQKYIHHNPVEIDARFVGPSAGSGALYLYTSSASSVDNLKCVPISHGVLAQGSYSRLEWFKSAWPETDFGKLRVLGWTPWSHIMGVSHDLGAATFATGGCYVFGVPPPGYPTMRASPVNRDRNRAANLLDGVLRTKPDVLIGVPWMLQGIHAIHSDHQRASAPESLKEAMVIRDALVGLKYLGLGGAQTTQETLRWATDLGIKVVQDMGMTELGRPLFHSQVANENIKSEGWSLADCLIDDAELVLIDNDGTISSDEGELVITSALINDEYLKYNNSAFSRTADGRITFRTGDVYSRTQDSKFVWRGKKEDYIQMATSETLDPRPIEETLKTCASIADCCVVGNNFLKRPSKYICAIILPAYPQLSSPSLTAKHAPISAKQMADITRAVASVNRTLPPPLRITWSRVLFLDEGKRIPRTKKGAVFRKKLEDEFGALLISYLTRKSGGEHEASISTREDKRLNIGLWTKDDAENLVASSVAEILGISPNTLITNGDLSFAELGMDSAMAVQIVNRLNTAFGLNLPLNTCHTFVDLTKLQQAILTELGMSNSPVHQAFPRSPRTPRENTVVIVGQALRLPGKINTPEALWDALINKREDIITHIPPERWDHKSFYRPPSSNVAPEAGDITFDKAGLIDATHYDNTFFGISAPEALFVPPAIRLILETVFEAFENAYIPISKVKGTNMGVFVGSGLDVDYHHLLYEEKGFQTYSRFYGTGMAASTACGRLSYLLDIHGPSTTIDTACSSGLVAFDQGVKYLQSGEGESAIVSTVNINLWPGSFSFLSAQKMTSPNSRCATFTDMADGYVPSEGCVTFILKTEAAALRDGDTILAVVKSSDVMHGGKSQGLVAPNVQTQIDLQHRLLYQANLAPSDIDFLEAHGTGTSLGDLIEIQGINQVFQGSHAHVDTPLIIGAAKSCVGHTELAAGSVGVLKTIASFKHASVPGLMHLTEHNMNPAIDCSLVPIHIPHDTVSLIPKHDPYRALVLANGFAGTIAGVVLEAPKMSASKQDRLHTTAYRPDLSMLFVVSAKSSEALQEYIRRYLQFCITSIPDKFQDICYTSCVGREHYRHRFACVASNMDELIKALDERLQMTSTPHRRDAPTRRVVFAFPGQGSHFAGMASSLAGRFPEFAHILHISATPAEELSGYPILSLLSDPESSFEEHNATQTAQICIFVYQYAVATWIKHLAVVPHGVLGHSLGEIAAAVIAGALSFELGLELVIRRAAILKSDPSDPGRMAIIAAPKETITMLIRELKLEDDLVIAVYNGPQSHVISGRHSAVELFMSRAKIVGLRATKLNVSQAFHSPLIWPTIPGLQKWVGGNEARFSDLQIKLYSTVSGGEFLPNSRLPSAYWVEHAREPVRFSDAVKTLTTDGTVDVVLDVGPQPFIWTSLQGVPHGKLSIATSAKPSKDQHRTFLCAMGSLFESGITLNMDNLFAGSTTSRIPIPSYPFQRRRHYPSYVPSRHAISPRGISSEHITEVQLEAEAVASPQFLVDSSLFNLLSDHRIEGRRIVPGAALVDFYARQAPFKALQSITFHEPMVVGSPTTRTDNDFDTKSGIFCLKSVGIDQAVLPSVICSGMATLGPLVFSQKFIDAGVPYESKRNKDEVYSSYANVEFGPSFQNIQELRMWSTHADSYIVVTSTSNTNHDRIRKLDCCLHGIGAVVHKQVPQLSELDGSFLPTSIYGYTLHSDNIPDAFICRYHLPFEVTRNFNVVSTAFEVLSHSGDLLISCAKYSLAWIPAGSAVQNKQTKDNIIGENDLQWCYQSWIPRSISEQTSPALSFSKYEQLLYVGFEGSPLANSMSRYGKEVHTIYLPTGATNFPPQQSRFDDIHDKLKFAQVSVIVDLTYDKPGLIPMSGYHHDVLEFMKLLLNRKQDISNFTLVSSGAVSFTANTIHHDRMHIIVPSTVAMVHGMLRVFRRETGLDTQTWALDLPDLDNETVNATLLHELRARQQGISLDRVIAYRCASDDGSLSRVVPVLRPMVDSDEEPLEVFAGTTVIVGMGSIGCALAQELISRGNAKVVFIGRRPWGDDEIEAGLARLESGGMESRSYVQADVTDLDSLRAAILKIKASHGSITSIIHTAAIVRDATIQKAEASSLDEVLAPKVTGAWNLHVVSLELCPSLKAFVLLSSISVSLGNQGQVGYVAGNYYMEVLASYRAERNMPATCIQLGAWESRLTEMMGDDTKNPVRIASHAEGIPMILKAMSVKNTVQVIAKLNVKMLAENAAYALDPLFEEILPTIGPKKARAKSVNAFDEITAILRKVIELDAGESLETGDTMTACGIDSIAFAQIRGRVMHQLGVEVPTKFLSDTFTVREMMDYVVVHYTT